MAEERIIDDDLDRNRKFKIRKNADGEEELYMDESVADEAEEELGFDVPDFLEDDEEAAVMTPEQLAERERLRLEEEERRRNVLAANLQRAEEMLAVPEYESALYSLSIAEELDGGNGLIHFMKLKALTRNFTDYTQLDDALETSDNVREYCTAEQKSELLALSEPLKVKLDEVSARANELNAQNEEKKKERGEVYAQRRAKAVKWFSLTASPFALFLILAIAFGTVMFAEQDGRNIILTIIFAALCLIFFIATLVTSRKLWAAQRNVALNNKNSSTSLGREYEAVSAEYRKLNALYTSFSEEV